MRRHSRCWTVRCPQICRKTVAAIDISVSRTYVRYMSVVAQSADWDDDVPIELYVVPPEEPGDPEPPFDAIEEAIRTVRNRNAADGQLAMCILHELRSTRGEALPVRDLVAAELAPALGIGIREATRRIDVTEVLADKLPRTLRMVGRGDLSWEKATALADEVAPLTR